MEYKWEKKARSNAMWIADHAVFGKNGKFQLFAIAVANHETGEGALIRLDEQTGGIFWADIAKDVLGDAMAQYNKSVTKRCE